MIFIFLTEFPTDALEDSTNYSPMESVHTKLPLKSPWDHLSVTSSPRLWSTTISGNFSSYDDIVCRSFCRQRR